MYILSIPAHIGERSRGLDCILAHRARVVERLDSAADNGIVWSASWVAVELDRFRRGRAIQETEHLGPGRCSGSLPLGSPECEVTRMKQIKIIVDEPVLEAFVAEATV